MTVGFHSRARSALAPGSFSPRVLTMASSWRRRTGAQLVNSATSYRCARAVRPRDRYVGGNLDTSDSAINQVYRYHLHRRKGCYC